MNKIACGGLGPMLLNEPADPLRHGVGNWLLPLLSNDERIAYSNLTRVENASKHASAVNDAVEVNQLQNFLARFAVERKAQPHRADPYDSTRRKFIKAVEVYKYILSEIARLETAFRHDRRRRDQYLPEWGARYAADDAAVVTEDRRDCCERGIVTAFDEERGDGQRYPLGGPFYKDDKAKEWRTA